MIDITTIGVGVDTAKLKAGSRELDNFGKSADSASRKADGLTDKNEKTGKSFSVMASGAKLAAVGLSAVGVSALALGAGVLQSFIQLEKLNNSLKFSTGSSQAAAKEIEYLKNTTNQLGLEFVSTSSAYAKFSAATKGTAIEGQKTRDVFESIAKASVVLGLSADESKGALNALQQMMSKGTVSAEELRGQLGERIPGAFNIAAKSIGVTTQELGKMLEQGQVLSADFLPKFAAELTKSLGDSPESAAGSAQAQLNKLTNAWTEFKQAIAESGVVTIVLKVAEGTTNALKWFNHFVFNKGELADLNKMNADRDNLAALELRVNSRKPQSSPIETSGMKQSRLNSFNTAQAKDKAEIRRLKIALGIDDGSSSMPATGNILDSLIAPSYAVKKKDGEGGYDASQNNQAQMDRLKDSNAKKYDDDRKKAKDAETKRNLGALELEYTTKARNLEELQDKIIANDEVNAKAYKAELKRVEALQDVANANYKEAQDSFKSAEAEKLREFEKTVDGINQTFREGFAQLVNGGKGSWKAFTKSLFTTFKTTVADSIYKLFAQPFVVKLVASILGVGATGSAAAGGVVESLTGGAGSGGTLSGLGDLFSGVKSLFSDTTASLISGIEGFGASIANGLGGIRDTIGGFIGANSSAIASTLPYAGALLQLAQGNVKGAAFSAAGVAIGNAIVPVIGGVVGGIIGNFVGGLFGGKKQPPRTVTQLPEVGQAFSGSINALLSGFDMQANSTASAQYKGRAGGSGYGTLNTNIGGIAGVLQTKDKGAYSQESMEKFINQVLGVELVKAIKSSNVSAGIKKFFDGMVDPQAINQSIVFLTGLNQALKNLPPVFNAVRNALDTTAYKVSLAQLESTFANTATFTSLFYSEAENFSIFTKQIVSQLSSLNVALPTSRDAYRKLVDGIQVTNEATFNQYSGLVALAPAMDAYFKQLEEQKQAVDALNQSMNQLDINRFKTFLDFNIAQSYVNAGRSIPAANMPSYAVGTDYVPNDGVAMLHQGEAVLTRSDNQSMAANTNAMVGLLNLMVTKLNELGYEIKRGADGSQRTARELEDITGGDVAIMTQAA